MRYDHKKYLGIEFIELKGQELNMFLGGTK